MFTARCGEFGVIHRKLALQISLWTKLWKRSLVSFIFWPHISNVLLPSQRSFTLATVVYQQCLNTWNSYLSWHSPPSLKLGRSIQPLVDLRAAEVGAALPSESSCIYSEVPRGCCSCFRHHVGCLPSTLTWYIQEERFSCESKNGDWYQGGQHCANSIFFCMVANCELNQWRKLPPLRFIVSTDQRTSTELSSSMNVGLLGSPSPLLCHSVQMCPDGRTPPLSTSILNHGFSRT